MKKNTVFVDLKGTLGFYAPNIYTETQSKDNDIRLFQAQLNVVLKDFKDKNATAGNCRLLWSKLKTICYQASNKIDNQDPVFIEIIEAVDRIGYKIAYICKRSGYEPVELTDNGKVQAIRVYDEDTDEIKIEMVKRQLLNDFWSGRLTEEYAEKENIMYITDEGCLDIANSHRMLVHNETMDEKHTKACMADMYRVMTQGSEKEIESLHCALEMNVWGIRDEWETLVQQKYTEENYYDYIKIARENKPTGFKVNIKK